MPKKFTADRGDGTAKEYGVTITEVNTNLESKEIHVVCRIIDPVTLSVTNHVTLIEGEDFLALMSTPGKAQPIYDILSESIWLYLNDKDRSNIVLGRDPAVDEVVPDWADIVPAG